MALFQALQTVSQYTHARAHIATVFLSVARTIAMNPNYKKRGQDRTSLNSLDLSEDDTAGDDADEVNLDAPEADE
jgi:hypothetical protein